MRLVRTGLPDTARSGLVAGFVVARGSLPWEGDVMVGEAVVDPEELLTGPEVARLLEIAPATWRAYVARGYAPPADVPGEGLVQGRRPRWRLETVREFRLARRGQGHRSDLDG